MINKDLIASSPKQELSSIETWGYKYFYSNGFETLRLFPSSMTLTHDGGFVIGNGGTLLKLNSLGTPEWQRSYNCLCSFVSIVEDPVNGFVAAGIVDTLNKNYIVLLRVDKNGNLIWSKPYRRKRFDTAHSLIRTRDGGYLIGAFSASLSSKKDGNMWLIKTGVTGAIQWQKIYNVAEPSSTTQLSNGDFLIGTSRFSVLRLATNGEVQWQRKYSSAGCCNNSLMQVFPNESFALAGNRTINAADSVVVLRANSAGGIVFSKSYDSQRLADFRKTNDNGFILLTRRFSHSVPARISVTKLDSDGNVSWRKLAKDKELNHPKQVRQTPDSGYVIVDSVEWIVKLDSSGNGSDLCRDVFASIQSAPQSITMKQEIRTPSVLNTQTIPLSATISSTAVTPIVESICSP